MSTPWIAARLPLPGEKWLPGGQRRPDAPRNVRVSARDSAARLYWEGAFGEGISTWYRLDGGDPILVETTVQGAHTILGLTNGVTYSVEMMVVTPYGESDWSTPVMVTPIPEGVFATYVTVSPAFLPGFVHRLDMSKLPAAMWDRLAAMPGSSVRVYDRFDDEVPIDFVWVDTAARTGLAFFRATVERGGNHYRIRVVAEPPPAPEDRVGRHQVWTLYLRVLIHDWTVDRTGKGALQWGGAGAPAAGSPLVGTVASPRWVWTPIQRFTAFTMAASLRVDATNATQKYLAYGEPTADGLWQNIFAFHNSQQVVGQWEYNDHLLVPSMRGVTSWRRYHHAQAVAAGSSSSRPTGAATVYVDGVPTATSIPGRHPEPGPRAGQPAGFGVGAGNLAGNAPIRGAMEWVYFIDQRLSDAWIEAEHRSWVTGDFADIVEGNPPLEARHRWWDGTQLQPANLVGWHDGVKPRPVRLLGWWDGVVPARFKGMAEPAPPPPTPEKVLLVESRPEAVIFTSDYKADPTLRIPGFAPGRLRRGDVVLIWVRNSWTGPIPGFITDADLPEGWALANVPDPMYAQTAYGMYDETSDMMTAIWHRVRDPLDEPAEYVIPWIAEERDRAWGVDFQVQAWRNVGTITPERSGYSRNTAQSNLSWPHPIGPVAPGDVVVSATAVLYSHRFSDDWIVARPEPSYLGPIFDHSMAGKNDGYSAFFSWDVVEHADVATIPTITGSRAGHKDNVTTVVVLPYLRGGAARMMQIIDDEL